MPSIRPGAADSLPTPTPVVVRRSSATDWSPIPDLFTPPGLQSDKMAFGPVPTGDKPAVGLSLAPTPPDPAEPEADQPAGHDTEIYSMDGELLDAFTTTSPYSHVMVDAAAYKKYLAAKFGTGGSPEDGEEATQFTTSLVKSLNEEETVTKTDLIALENKEVLTFEGRTSDFKFGADMVRQLGEGQLSVVAVFDNGKRATIDSFAAISGPMNNGVIPNGGYKAFAPIDASNQFPDEKGWGFKMVLQPEENMGRGSFRIHTVQDRRQHLAWMTEGCIGLANGHLDGLRFHGEMQAYFKTHKSIELTVNLDGNANVKTQLNGSPSYKAETTAKP